MTYQEVLAAARTCSGPYCKACPVCNGKACGSTMPGPGSKGTGTVAVRNYQAWQEICLNMDTICENGPVDTKFNFFGQEYDLPVFAGPVGAVNLHYGDKYNDLEYNNILVPACAQAGIAAFTGDGTNPDVFTAAASAIGAAGGKGIPTVKPWDKDTLYGALTMRNGVVDVLGQWKIEVKVTMSDKLLIPKYSGAVEFRYAAPATEQNAGTDEGVG